MIRLLLFLLPVSAAAQRPLVEESLRLVDTLCRFDGRGYVDSADWRAAQFIVAHLRRLGTTPLADNYLQPFSVSVNTFPGRMQLVADGTPLQAGKDYLVEPASPPTSGRFAVQSATLKPGDTSARALLPLLRSVRRGKLRLLEIRRHQFTDRQYALLREFLISNKTAIAGVLELRPGKLTWHVADRQARLPWLLFNEHTLPHTPRSVALTIDAQWKSQYRTQNVAALLPGKEVPDSFIVFTAHYDHLGCMGKEACFPGANDNASGVTMLLQLAAGYQANPLRYSVVLLFFGAEELGLLGSRHFVQHPLIALERIRFLINLDIVGTGDEGIKVVNATAFPQDFQLLVGLNEQLQALPAVLPRGPAANSDHYPFFVRGVPCFFVYTLGGIAAYHDVHDRPETLPLTEFEDLYLLLNAFARRLSGEPEAARP